MLITEVLPEAASASRLVDTPGSAAGVNVTVPSSADVAVEVCVAKRMEGGQTLWGPHGGAHA